MLPPGWGGGACSRSSRFCSSQAAVAACRYCRLVGSCGWSAGEEEVGHKHLAGRPGQEVRLHAGHVHLIALQAPQHAQFWPT